MRRGSGHPQDDDQEIAGVEKELFGIDNVLVGDWPVVVIENGKAVIKEFRSIPEWWDMHDDLVVRHFTEMGEMYHQRG